MGTTTAGPIAHERRSLPRMPIEGCVVRVRRCRWPWWTPAAQEHTAAGMSLSFSGLAMRGRQHYRTGEHVLLTIQPMQNDLPVGETLTLRGRVVWSEQCRTGSRETTGIRFAGSPDHLRATISAWAARAKQFLR
jgi:Tfp pilus assembly protein PilZ